MPKMYVIKSKKDLEGKTIAYIETQCGLLGNFTVTTDGGFYGSRWLSDSEKEKIVATGYFTQDEVDTFAAHLEQLRNEKFEEESKKREAELAAMNPLRRWWEEGDILPILLFIIVPFISIAIGISAGFTGDYASGAAIRETLFKSGVFFLFGLSGVWADKTSGHPWSSPATIPGGLGGLGILIGMAVKIGIVSNFLS